MGKVKVGFAKVGNIGCSPLVEFLLDERAEREDLEVRTIGSGSKMDPESCVAVVDAMVAYKPDLIVFLTPNAALPGPAKAREMLKESKTPAVIVSDNPAKKVSRAIEEAGLGYIIVEGDVMIGARREFLDPVEMACFNADIIKILAVSGVFEIIRSEIDKLIETIKKGSAPELPRIVIGRERVSVTAGYANPYAQAKATSAYEIARRAGELNFEGCFVEKNWEKYVQLVCSGHEIIRAAARLADEAREIEKDIDLVSRRPHDSQGQPMLKRKLMEKPKSE
jgi:methylenetetrahydromethanopterin dehydrogenase